MVLLVEKGGDQSGEVLEDSGSRVIILLINFFAKGRGWIGNVIREFVFESGCLAD